MPGARSKRTRRRARRPPNQERAATAAALSGSAADTDRRRGARPPHRTPGGLMSTRVMPSVRPLRDRPAWKALEKHYEEMRGKHLRELFAADATRGERLVAEGAGLYLDYSKNRITDETIRAAGRAGRAVRACPTGSRRCSPASTINVSEDRSVLHVALRMPTSASLIVDGVDVVKQVHEVLDRMAAFSERVRSRRVAGPHRQADPQRGQHRHRRLGPRPGDGLRGAPPLQRPRAARSGSSRTSTRPTSSRRRATSTRPRRCSSSPRRRSRRSRR